MTRLIKLSYILLGLMALISSCSKPSPVTRLPKNAGAVVKINPAKLALKAISLEDLWQSLTATSKDTATKKGPNIAEAGLDYANDAYLFTAQVKTPTADDEMYLAAIMGVDNSEKLVTFLKNYKEVEVLQPTNSGINMAYAKGQNMLIGWNKEFVIALGGSQSMKGQGSESAPQDWQKNLVEQLLTNKEDAGIAKNSILFGQFDDQADELGLYINAANVDLGTKAEVETYMTASLEKGKILIDGVSSTRGELARMNAITSVGVRQGFLNSWPAYNELPPVAAMTAAVEPDSLSNLLEQFATTPGLMQGNMALALAGTNIGEILQCWDGQLGFTFRDEKMQLTDMESSQFVVRIGIRDMALTKAILERLTKAGLLVATAEPGVYTPPNGPVRIKLGDKSLTALYGADGGGNTPAQDWTTKLEGKAFSMSMNMQHLNGLLRSSNAMPTATNELKELDVIKFISMEAEPTKDGRSTFKAEVVMVDDSKNSLLTLVQSMQKAFESKQGQQLPIPDEGAGADEFADTSAISIQ